MSTTLPKTLQRFASKIADISDERAGGDGFWVYLKSGWKDGSDPVGACHQIHENTITECADRMRLVQACNCRDCTR